ncbi:aminoglycoside 3'-phosphotransferase/choline kinase family protein [Phanerochaete sordida]|uniref:Aminoglycoside 3'-phosphotransferase/choline kinase family protein n=1 Tax=Phanerochaete sordida TaxID=48140 RepID=A0A9P3GP19_9APHY|nr:aminoglycoside 3'-phosphotransferase/choline kinase family protein [Phanerochaete sordida]
MPASAPGDEGRLEFPRKIWVGWSWLHPIHGLIHRRILMPFSAWYSRHFTVADDGVMSLPFNLVLKWTTKVRVEEAVAMVAAREIGLPVPRLLAYGSPGGALPGGTILMTRIPGAPLSEVRESLSEDELETIRAELGAILARMRAYRNPAGRRIASVAGTSLTGHLIPLPRFDPCPDEASFHAVFMKIGVGCRHLWEDPAAYERYLASAQMLLDMEHETVFTHGDLRPHNIMVHEGHVSGIIDWECAGWMPEYWEYTNAARVLSLDSWWARFVMSLPGFWYPREMEAARAMSAITGWSWSW